MTMYWMNDWKTIKLNLYNRISGSLIYIQKPQWIDLMKRIARLLTDFKGNFGKNYINDSFFFFSSWHAEKNVFYKSNTIMSPIV